MKLMVCSPSTKNFLKGEYDRLIITKAPTIKMIARLENCWDEVIAIGGGAVMDTAKIICKNPIIAYPTTASGACMTSHAVMWDGKKKLSIKTYIPKKVIIKKEYLKTVPKKVLEYTRYDALAHCIEGLMSKKATKESTELAIEGLKLLSLYTDIETIIKAGNIGGKVIEITGTNMYHALSYPLTAYYNIPHGKALGFLFKKVKIPNINMRFIIKEGLKYSKIHDTILDSTKKDLIQRLK